METTHNWDLLDAPGVLEVCEQAAARVDRWVGGWDAEELRQEACLLVVSRADLAEAIGMSLGVLQYRLERDLLDRIKSQVGHRNNTESLDERYDDNTDYAPHPVALSVRNDVSAYTRELVEALLPAVWDESFAYGMRVENAPDDDMPRGSANKATGGTLAAHLADIKVGWKRAPLTRNERRALLLTYGFDYTQAAAGGLLGVSQKSVSNWLYSGVGKVMAYLNGDTDLSDYLSVMDEQLEELGVV